MKRHVQLQPLSRQHHNGLLMALLLSKGLKKKASVEVMSDFICSGWTNELKEHFEMEEFLLIPVLLNKSFFPFLIQQLQEDHNRIRSIVQKAMDHSATEQDITAFSSELEKHIRFEEKIFFPKAEEILSERELEEIGSQFHEDRTSNCINYSIKFWE